MGMAGRRKRKNSHKSKKHANPIHGVDVRNQDVEIITRKVEPSEMTKAPFHLANSPFRRKDLKT